MNSPCLRHGCTISASLPSGQALRHPRAWSRKSVRREKRTVMSCIRTILSKTCFPCRRKWRDCAAGWPAWPPRITARTAPPARKPLCNGPTGSRPAGIVGKGMQAATTVQPVWNPSFTASAWEIAGLKRTPRPCATVCCRWMTRRAIPFSPARQRTTGEPMPICMRTSARRWLPCR